LLQTKLIAPAALGILANRTQSSSAVETLINAASLEEAQKLVGMASAKSLSKSAINGLAISNTSAGDAFINANVDANFPIHDIGNAGIPAIPSNVTVAPFAPNELEALTKSHQAIRNFGVETMFNLK
jgi:hypothetical protein